LSAPELKVARLFLKQSRAATPFRERHLRWRCIHSRIQATALHQDQPEQREMDFKTIKNPVVRTELYEQQLPAPDGKNERVHRSPAMSDWRWAPRAATRFCS